MIYMGTRFQATGGVTTATTAALLAAVTGATHYVTKIVITIYGYQDAGIVSLTDGSTTYFSWLAKDGNGPHYEVTFDPSNAFSWGTGKAINLTVSGANVSCKAVIMGFTKQG